MLSKAKTAIRDLLPPGLQVPAKYWFSRLRGHIEPEMALLPRLVKRGDHVIDVGGNRGTYAYRLAALGAKVEVFEPNAACHRGLSAWAGQRRDIAIHAVALSATEGEGTLTVPIDADGTEHDSSGSLEHASDGDAHHITVPLRTLDSFGFDRIAFIKIDVEGHEASVIAGAHATIAAGRPALLVEIEQRHLSRPIADVFGEVAALGYRGYFQKNGRMTPIADFDAAVDQAPENLGPGGEYRNNFLFLDAAAVDTGKYRTVIGG